MSTWKIYPNTEIYFCTSTIVDWYPVFTSFNYYNILTECLAYCRKEKGLRIHGYVIMLNHLHLLASSSGEPTMSDIMRDFKRYTSGQLSAMLNKKGQEHALGLFRGAVPISKTDQNYKVWQTGFHPIGIESASFFREKLHYIHLNPVRKGYVIKPEHWLYSSARNYAGLQPVPLTIDFLN